MSPRSRRRWIRSAGSQPRPWGRPRGTTRPTYTPAPLLELASDRLPTLPTRLQSGVSRRAAVLHRGRVQRAPQKPARERPVGDPGHGDLLEPLRVRQLPQAIAVHHRPANAEVTGRQYVRAAEVEHQKHVGAPGAESLDGHQLGDHLLIREVVEALQLERTLDDVLG